MIPTCLQFESGKARHGPPRPGRLGRKRAIGPRLLEGTCQLSCLWEPAGGKFPAQRAAPTSFRWIHRGMYRHVVAARSVSRRRSTAALAAQPGTCRIRARLDDLRSARSFFQVPEGDASELDELFRSALVSRASPDTLRLVLNDMRAAKLPLHVPLSVWLEHCVRDHNVMDAVAVFNFWRESVGSVSNLPTSALNSMLSLVLSLGKSKRSDRIAVLASGEVLLSRRGDSSRHTWFDSSASVVPPHLSPSSFSQDVAPWVALMHAFAIRFDQVIIHILLRDSQYLQPCRHSLLFLPVHTRCNRRRFFFS